MFNGQLFLGLGFHAKAPGKQRDKEIFIANQVLRFGKRLCAFAYLASLRETKSWLKHIEVTLA
jgi:hypothetical protein